MRRTPVVILILYILIEPTFADGHAPASYFPEDSWRTSSAEERNMDGSYLDRLHEIFDPRGQIAIIKDGYLVGATSPERFTKKEHIHSCTKSIISLLYGMVFAPDATSEKIVDLFPEYARADNRDVTVGHLLSMTSGMEWSDIPNIDSNQLTRERDWVKYILSKKIAKKPGECWNYNSGGSQLISVIVQNELVRPLESYAKEKLFSPLGIPDYTWWKSNDGYLTAGWGLFLSAFDLSKIGYMLLNDGTWNGAVVIRSDWIREISSRKAKVNGNFSYGFQWWIYDTLPFEAYKAYGSYGDHSVMLIVIPQYGTEIIITGNINNDVEILKEYIAPALMKRNVIY